MPWTEDFIVVKCKIDVIIYENGNYMLRARTSKY
eukprot:SAG31_NODE_3450_length_4256_cov_7.431080_2_plen_34_part_00